MHKRLGHTDVCQHRSTDPRIKHCCSYYNGINSKLIAVLCNNIHKSTGVKTQAIRLDRGNRSSCIARTSHKRPTATSGSSIRCELYRRYLVSHRKTREATMMGDTARDDGHCRVRVPPSAMGPAQTVVGATKTLYRQYGNNQQAYSERWASIRLGRKSA